MAPRSYPAALATVALIGILWGLNWPVVKTLLTEFEPLTIRAMAFPAAALCLALAAKWLGQELTIPRAEILPMAATGLFLVFGFNVLTSFGQLMVESAKATIIAYLMPALTAFLASIFLAEKLTKARLFALFLGLAGLLALASEDWQALVNEPLGPLIMLLAALSWAIGNVAIKSRSWTAEPLVMTVWFFAFSSLMTWPLAMWFETPLDQTVPDVRMTALFAYHILGPMVVCYLVWTTLLGQLPAAVAALAVMTAPLTGVVSSILLLGEPLTAEKTTALMLILASIAATLRKS